MAALITLTAQVAGPTRGAVLAGRGVAFFRSPAFSCLVVPGIFVLLGALSKWLGRRDNDNAPHWNEAAVGTSVVVMTTGKVFSDLCAPDAQVLVLAVVALLAFLTILAFSGADRHFSWERVGSVVTNRKRFWVGVVIPDLIAFGLFVCYQKMKLNGYFN